MTKVKGGVYEDEKAYIGMISYTSSDVVARKHDCTMNSR